jgi:TrmH family RNA methyltransferase
MKLDDIKKLHQKKYREELGHFLLEGEHLVLELQKAALKNAALNSSELFVTSTYQDWASDFKTTLITDKQMQQISDTKTPQGILAVAPLHALQAQGLQTTERAIYLHQVQDPGNLGTILRTLAWFGGFRLLLSSGSVDPFNPKVVRSSMGAIFHVPMEFDVQLEDLAQRFKRVAYLDMQGKAISHDEFSECDCFLFGNEARGVPREALVQLGAEAFTIEGAGVIESLNLATAVNICTYELQR